jgi:hypothetical protein
MPVEITALTAVSAALNFFVRGIQAGYEIAAVPSETSELLETISQVRSDIRSAKEKRNCIAKSWEANELTDMDKAIEAVELALAGLEKLVEPARVDMKLNHGQIRAWKKLMWVLRDSKSVLATSSRLMLAHSRFQNQMLMTSLSPLIGREASLRDERKCTSDTTFEPPPPPYDHRQQATKAAIHERRQSWRPASTGRTTSTGLSHRRASSGVDAPDLSPPNSAALPGRPHTPMPNLLGHGDTLATSAPVNRWDTWSATPAGEFFSDPALTDPLPAIGQARTAPPPEVAQFQCSIPMVSELDSLPILSPTRRHQAQGPAEIVPVGRYGNSDPQILNAIAPGTPNVQISSPPPTYSSPTSSVMAGLNQSAERRPYVLTGPNIVEPLVSLSQGHGHPVEPNASNPAVVPDGETPNVSPYPSRRHRLSPHPSAPSIMNTQRAVAGHRRPFQVRWQEPADEDAESAGSASSDSSAEAAVGAGAQTTSEPGPARNRSQRPLRRPGERRQSFGRFPDNGGVRVRSRSEWQVDQLEARMGTLSVEHER